VFGERGIRSRYQTPFRAGCICPTNTPWLRSHMTRGAHEFLGDPLEVRNFPPETLEQRIRQIRIRRCRDFALLIGDHKLSALRRELVHPFPHPRLPTLLLSGPAPIDLDLLIESVPAITKLGGRPPEYVGDDADAADTPRRPGERRQAKPTSNMPWRSSAKSGSFRIILPLHVSVSSGGSGS
jgi:hypothetical protein